MIIIIQFRTIGIDFEKVNIQTKNDLAIAFSKSDWKFVSNDVQKIYQYFSLKESYSKMTGTGFTMEPAKIDLKLLKKNSFYTLFEKNEILFVFTAIALYLDPNKFLDLHLKSLHLE